MADKSHNQTDKLLEQMEKRISAIYAEAQVDMKKKAEAYFDAFIAEGDRKLKLVKAGKLSEAEYQKWVKNKIAYGKRFDQFKQQYAEAMSHVNEIAAAYINDQLPDIYALNYNGAGEDIASQVGGYSFTMVDANTVKNLATRDTTLLPYKYIDGKKDVRWNTQKVNAAITQGILQGESIPNIAKRLSKNIPEMNKASAIRNARTATTGAECAGRQSQYEEATRRGIQLQREWIAAIDMRTRHAHRLLDGQLADVDKPFESELGDIMLPGDPEAHPANVYNCRCTTAARVLGFESKSNKNHLTFDGTGGIIQGENMHRKSANTGAFKQYPERMSKKHIRDVAKECGIDIKGLTIKIEQNEDLVSLDITGIADSEHIGAIIFMPNAFISKEELIRTIYHEKIHVEQFKKHGSIFVQNNRKAFEEEAYEKEAQFIKQLKERGII